MKKRGRVRGGCCIGEPTGYIRRLRRGISIELVLILALLLIGKGKTSTTERSFPTSNVNTSSVEEEYIKWVDFNVSYEALCDAYDWDADTHGTAHEVPWIELLAYTAAVTGGTFDKEALKILNETAGKVSKGEASVNELGKALKYYPYYMEAYTAVLGGMVGEFEEEAVDENGKSKFVKKYGLKAYFPLAKGFDYNHYDDFGAGRSYGYKRKHLGHDMMGQTGTPIIAVESGVIEAIGWNQYGGWRIGVRSFDGLRYYYYAHLRQNYPYADGLEEGSVVTAGDVIGYMGHTGYSAKENVNNIDVTHLHWGLELIFNEERRADGYEIWVDVYPLTRFLAKHRQQAEKVEGTKHWVRSTGIVDPVVEKMQ